MLHHCWREHETFCGRGDSRLLMKTLLRSTDPEIGTEQQHNPERKNRGTIVVLHTHYMENKWYFYTTSEHLTCSMFFHHCGLTNCTVDYYGYGTSGQKLDRVTEQQKWQCYLSERDRAEWNLIYCTWSCDTFHLCKKLQWKLVDPSPTIVNIAFLGVCNLLQ